MCIYFRADCMPAPGPANRYVSMEKIHEPNEKAFTILKPKGWLAEGGIVRWDPSTMGGAANAIEAKIDFALMSDEAGSFKIHWLPDIYYADLTGQAVAGMFPEGSWYNGMPVLHKMDAIEFLRNNPTFLISIKRQETLIYCHQKTSLKLRSSVTIWI